MCIDDGLCAIDDFITLINSNKSSAKFDINLLKAQCLKAYLLEETYDRNKAIELMQSILPNLIKYKLNKKAEKINAFLNNH